MDVLVVGAGPAGLAAAMAAKDRGASVLVLERQDRAGGSALDCHVAWFSGTPEQAERGIVDSVDAARADWSALTGGDPDDPWVVQYLEGNVGVRNRLSARGVRFQVIEDPEREVSRLHSFSGPALVGTLVRPLRPEELWLGCEAKALAVEEEVVEVQYGCADGRRGVQLASTAVLATGGFLRDERRVREVLPGWGSDPLWWSTGAYADGWGLTVALDAGGHADNLGAVGMGLNATPDPRPGRSGGAVSVVSVAHGPLVDSGGSRFTDERDAFGADPGRKVLDRPGAEAWLIVDQETWSQLRFEDAHTGDALSHADIASGPWHHEAAEVGGIAALAGVDAGGLQATVDLWNAASRGEADLPYRDDEPQLRPLVSGPLHAVRIVPTLTKGWGGLVVDLDGRVVDAAGEPIPGLYAAGELTGMAGGSLVGDRGWRGSISAVLLGGFVAGEAAAKAARP